jgi:hypothetical protein
MGERRPLTELVKSVDQLQTGTIILGNRNWMLIKGSGKTLMVRLILLCNGEREIFCRLDRVYVHMATV